MIDNIYIYILISDPMKEIWINFELYFESYYFLSFRYFF